LHIVRQGSRREALQKDNRRRIDGSSDKGNINSFLQEDSIPESGTDFGMGSPDASRKATKFNFNFEDEDGMNTNATNSTYGDPSGVLENSQNSSTNQKKDRLKNSAPSGMNQRAK
jgi:hypothetical protein